MDRRWAALLVGGVLLGLVAGCSANPSAATSPVSSPPPAARPTESKFERQEREAYAGARRAYEDFRLVYAATTAGDAPRASPTMSRLAGGPYLARSVRAMATQRRRHLRLVGRPQSVVLEPVAFQPQPARVLLRVCEDSRGTETVDRSGRAASHGRVETALVTVIATQADGGWQVWDSSERRTVATCAVEGGATRR